MSTSHELTGGAGFTFEAATSALYLTALLNGTTAIGVTPSIVTRVSLQQGTSGRPLDDLVVETALNDGNTARLDLQIKRSLVISAAKTNIDFREVIYRSWLTIRKTDFRENIDRVGGATGTVSDASHRLFTTVCGLAQGSDTPAAFIQRLEPDGSASQEQRNLITGIRSIIQEEANVTVSDAELHFLLRHLLLIKLDLLHDGATHEATAIIDLQRSLVAEQVDRAGDLWAELQTVARNGMARGATFSKASLLRQIHRTYRFRASPTHTGDITVLAEFTQYWLSQQDKTINGHHIQRSELFDKAITASTEHRLSLIRGIPGTGKTILLRALVEDAVSKGPVLLLPANRLNGKGWQEFAQSIGLSASQIRTLLAEIAAAGTSTLFIDGLDRVDPAQRPIITDLISIFLADPDFSDWRVIATTRDAGIEPLRNWMPSALFDMGGIGYVDVGLLSDEEAEGLAQTVPALRPLLFGDERVRHIARRPFFSSVLARGLASATYAADFSPRSEIDLINAWWDRGGYDAEQATLLHRQRALMQLAEQSAPELGKSVRISTLSSDTVSEVPTLTADGLIQPLRSGHTLQFTHDIFFEWSFFHLLLDRDDQWIDLLSGVGEPPALARVIELLSQASFTESITWHNTLNTLSSAVVRPQWVRAWLMGPFSSSTFEANSAPLIDLLCTNDHRFLGKLLVWFQAEKTTPHPGLLSGELGSPDLTAKERLELADLLSLPSDVMAWRRLLTWVISNLSRLPQALLPDLVTLFKTWQILGSNIPNPLSEHIIQLSNQWLSTVEEERKKPWQTRAGQRQNQNQDSSSWAPYEIEKELRGLILGAARSYPEIVSQYLSKHTTRRSRDDVFKETIALSALLTTTHPDLLLDIARAHLLEELPDESTRRWERDAKAQSEHRVALRAKPEEELTHNQRMYLDSVPSFPPSFSYHDFHDLCIGGNHQGYFPSSPLREPFNSAFTNAPDKALIFVRDLANHAILAWRQLHNHHVPGMEGTPAPLVIEFPWGKQEFWGNIRDYTWDRGTHGPHAIASGLMALEAWAVKQIDGGADVDALLKKIIEGHSSIAVLGVAVALILHSKRISITTLPIVTCQKLWLADIQRWVNDQSKIPANLIGFDHPDTHHQAVVALNGLLARRNDIRCLVPLFLLSNDSSLQKACRSAIDNFVNDLPFEYEEEKQDAALVESLRERAVHWGEWGHAENYKLTKASDQDNTVFIELDHPKNSGPEIQKIIKSHEDMARGGTVWLWVDETFKQGRISSRLSIDEAVKHARSVSAELQALADLHTHGLIAGVAAVVVCFAPENSDHVSWANTAIATYRDECEQPLMAPPSADITWHPKIFVAKAISAKLRSGIGDDSNRLELYRLITHPLESIAIEALQGAMSCWATDARFSWSAINLGFRLCRLTRQNSGWPHTQEITIKKEAERRSTAFAESFAEYKNSDGAPALIGPLPYWATNTDDTDTESVVRTDDVWLYDFAIKVLKSVSLQHVMSTAPFQEAYVQYFEGLVGWTITSLENSGGNNGHHHTTELFSWERYLGRALADLAGHMEANVFLKRLLKPILAAPDHIFAPIVARFADMLACLHVMDSDSVRPGTIDLLMACLDRMLKHEDFVRTGYRAGEIHGDDLHILIRTFLFVTPDQKCEGSKRFANWQWDDLPIVQPLINKIVSEAGWIPAVVRAFIRLCDRAEESYSATLFADQLFAHVTHGFPKSWKGTLIPAGIARNVQAHADRQHPLDAQLAKHLLHILDALVDLGDRRSAALQMSEAFRGVRIHRSTGA